MNKWLIVFAVLVLTAFVNAELVTNGGFETNGGDGTEPDNWTKDFSCYGAFAAGYNGSYCLHPGNSGLPGGAYQDITTVAGKYYEVSLWIQNFGSTGTADPLLGNIKVIAGSPGTDTYAFENQDNPSTTSAFSLDGLFDQNLPTSMDGSWSLVTAQFQAIGTTTRIGVYNAPLAGGWSTNVDDVSVVAATKIPATNPVVEPDNGNGTYGTVIGAEVQVTLNWDAGSDPCGLNAVSTKIKTHYIYLASYMDASGDPNFSLVGQVDQSGQTVLNSYGPIMLDPDVFYHWSIEEGLNDGTGNAYAPGNENNIPGAVWSFVTAPLVAEIVTEPAGDVADPDASFTVVAAAVENYQWYKVATPDTQLSDEGKYSGTQTATLTVTAPALADEGQYYCVVSNSVPSQATSASAQLWTQRLMGHWKLDGNMLDSVGDTVSGAPGHDGAIGINTTVPGGGDPNYAGSGIDGDAMTFHDDGDYVQIPDGDFFNFYQDGLTASCWYKSDADVGWRLPLNKSDETDEDANLWRGWLFGINAGGIAAVVNPNWQYVGSAAGVNYADGQWHLMTATYDPSDSSLKYYTDGDYTWQVEVAGMSNPPALPAPLCIGGRDGQNSIDGTIDDVRVYSYPLSSQEVATLYTDLKSGKSICTSETDPVFARIDFDDNCQIDMRDFAVLASKWLDCMIIPTSACDQ